MDSAKLPNDPTRMPNEDERFDEWWASACALPPYTLEHLRWAFNAGGMTQRMLNSSREQSKGTPWICQQCGLKNYPDDPECRDAMCGGMRGDLQDAKQSEGAAPKSIHCAYIWKASRSGMYDNPCPYHKDHAVHTDPNITQYHEFAPRETEQALGPLSEQRYRVGIRRAAIQWFVRAAKREARTNTEA